MLELKGPLFHSTLKVIKTKLGEKDYDSFVSQLTPDLQDFLSRPILSSKFYPASLLTSIAEAFVTHADLNPLKTYHEIGRTSAELGFSGVYKIFLKVGTPAMMLGNSRHLYKAYYSQGVMESVKTGDGEALVKILDSGIEHLSLCTRMTGFIERTMEMSGGKDVKVDHICCFSRGDTYEAWKGTWS